MNANEKAAWTELIVSLAACGVALALAPFLGNAATSGFALLGLLPLSWLFFRRRGGEVMTDERDDEIDRRAKYLSALAGWFTLLLAVIGLTMWSNFAGDHTVRTWVLNWLVWVQFVVVCGGHGLASVVLYRRQAHAA
ncbi:MAG TPA: hypothetical protein VMF30_16670 [Pirellulales bacterium]|nr:hypothetical protein [Pirellulales bacterium]